MAPSRLALAAVVSLRAVLVYGEATSAASAELTWGELLPAVVRRRARARAVARAQAATRAQAAGVIRPAPSS